MLICIQQIMRYLWRCVIAVIVHQLIIISCFQSGCSLRLLNPQAFSATVWNVLSILQENFGSMAGANMWVPGALNFPETFRYGLINVHNICFVVFLTRYLTPPGTQGFAPHYDDIEAFVVQLEGKKHWRVYNPRWDTVRNPPLLLSFSLRTSVKLSFWYCLESKMNSCLCFQVVSNNICRAV